MFLKKLQDIKNERKGSLFVEILVVIVMLGLLTGLEVFNTNVRRSGQNLRTSAAVQIREIENALALFYEHNGFYPSTMQGLNALVIKPTMSPQPKNYSEGGYMKRVPVDPWGNPFIYRNPGEKGLGLVDIISCGRDGEEGTEDDITNHNNDTIPMSWP